MMPMMVHNLLESVRLLASAARVFAERCVAGIEANADRCAELIEQSLAMCTSLAPLIGYDQAAAIAKEAFASGKTVREIALKNKVLDEARLNEALDAMSMTKPS
jgi:fumarate hydratase class II